MEFGRGVVLLLALALAFKLRPSTAAAEEPVTPRLEPLAQLGDPSLRHWGSVHDALFSANGKRLVSIDMDGVKCWDSSTGKLERDIGGFKEQYGRTLALSEDGGFCAAGSILGEVRIFEIGSGRLVSTFSTGKDEVRSITFVLRDSRVVIATGEEIVICDPQDGKSATRTKCEFPVEAVFVEPGADHFWTAEVKPAHHIPGTLFLNRRRYSDLRVVNDAQVNFCEKVVVSRDGKQWAASRMTDTYGSAVCGGEREDHSPAWELPSSEESSPECMAFTPDGKSVLVGMMNGDLESWNIETRKRTWSSDFHQHRALNREINAIRISPDGTRLAVSSSDGVVSIHNTTTGEVLAPSRSGHRGSVAGLAFRPKCRQILSTGEDGSVILWDIGSSSEAAQRSGLVGGPVISPNGEIVMFTRAGTETWSLPSLKTLWGPKEGYADCGTIAFSPDSKHVVYDDSDGDVHVRRTSDGEEHVTVASLHAVVEQLRFTGNGKKILCQFARHEDWIHRIHEFDRNGSPGTVVFTAAKGDPALLFVDDTRAVMPSAKGALILDLRSGKRSQPIFGEPVTFLDRSLIAGDLIGGFESDFRTLHLADLKTNREAVLDPLEIRCRDFVLCPDGDHIALVGADNVIRVYSIRR